MKHIGKIFILLAIVLVFSVTIVQADVLPPGGGSGAIFTTTPDGSIVNENVHYTGRHYVYLDGGPKQNAPPQAAGLDEGFYVFQITDPPGKILLSRDPARCRIVHVNEFGVIDQLMAPTDAIVEDPDGNTVVDYTGAISDNWQDPGNGNRPYADEPCHVPGPDPDSAPGTYAPTPDITGVGRHDTNPDVDHNDVGAIVAQMMPYGLTPNPGGVYKAWMTPIQAYTSVKQAGLNEVPSQLPKGKQKPHECFDFCADADPGFEPSHRYTKTDNFKVTEKFPAEIKVRKFDDLDGDGVWDENEPEIGVDECVDANGDFIDCPGGWPYDFTEPLDGGTKTDTFYTPHTHVAGIAGTYTAEEYHLTGWTQTAAYLDGDFVYDGSDPAKAVSVNVLATAPGETHEIIFGNFKNVDVEACKYEDKTGDGLTADDTPISGWTVYLTKNGAVQDTQTTGANGCYKWTDLGPVPGGYYDVSEDTPTGWTPTSATSHNFESPPMSGASYTFTFTNFKNVDVEACKYEDKTGDGLTADDTPISGWTVYLTKNGAVQDTQTTGANGCYKWTDLGPVPGGYYDVSEDTPTGWTPTSATSHNFESPPMSGASYTFTFTNFKNVDVEACKLKDADGSLLTTDDQTPIQGWTVHLTKNGAVQDTQTTGANGCYKWTDLGPVAGGYYDVSEEVPDGWIPLTPTFKAFESPPRSGASYSFTFINTPTQGCTPGFWQGGPDKPDSKAGGALLWDGFATVPPEDDPNYPGNPQPPPYVDPQWVASGGYDGNPYIHTTPFSTFFTEYDIPNDGTTSDYTMFELVNTGGGSENWRKLARDVVAAYLNSSWGMAYAYTPGEIEAIWDDAVEKDTFLYWHTKLDAANNGPGGCPISASGW
jgi:hypothetical protein